jgi:hypothetical protein
MATFIAV